MCTVLLPPAGYPIAVNKYIVSYQNITPVYRFVIQGRFIHWPRLTSGTPDSVVYVVHRNYLNIYHMRKMIFLPKPVMESLN